MTKTLLGGKSWGIMRIEEIHAAGENAKKETSRPSSNGREEVTPPKKEGTELSAGEKEPA